jgi:PAS domain S-box-containing protein
MSLSVQSTAGSPAYVLLVEDDHGLAELVCDTVLELGLAVQHAANGAEALRLLAAQRPVLLLVDYSLTDMKAPDFLDAADKLPGGVPPFIVITGAGDERIAVSLMKRGARDYLLKDRNFLDELPMALGRVLREMETQHKLAGAEKALRESEGKFRAIFEHSPVCIAIFGPDRRLLNANAALAAMLGRTQDELIHGSLSACYPPEDLQREMARLDSLMSGDIQDCTAEKRFLHKNGRTLWGSESVTIIRDPEGLPMFGIAVVIDITERKQAEQQLRDTLDEKEVLLREVHHRVKNNLQAIIHLIGLQADAAPETTRLFLAELQEQARTMAVVYQQLYLSENLAQVEMGLYLRSLADNLIHAFAHNRRVSIDVEADAAKMDVETATPCGMIANELITNSLKYAFEGRDEGRIRVALTQAQSGWELVITDDGKGLPSTFDLKNLTSLGLRLVKLWVTHQLGGTLEISSDSGGTTFRIRFSPRQKSRPNPQSARAS